MAARATAPQRHRALVERRQQRAEAVRARARPADAVCAACGVGHPLQESEQARRGERPDWVPAFGCVRAAVEL